MLQNRTGHRVTASVELSRQEGRRRKTTFIALLASCAIYGTVTKAATATACGIVALLLASSSCMAQNPGFQVVSTPPQGPVQLATGFEYGYLLTGSDGQAHLVIDLHAPAPANFTSRAPMAVSLVIDRSGSMAGEKMRNAIAAATCFIRNLNDGDVIAIYAYDDVVDQIAAPTILTEASRLALVSSLMGLHPRGSTNIHAGLTAGINALASPGSERPIRRVILISDGLANVGPSSARALGGVASRAARGGVSVTSIGVGLDYSEATLGAIAVRSGGRFYHLQEPAQMVSILESELLALNQTVARGTIIDLIPATGVQVINATGADIVRRGQVTELRVGDVLGGQRRAIVVTLRVPTSGGPLHRAARLALRYSDPESGVAQAAAADVSYLLSASEVQVQESLNPQFALLVERHEAALVNQRAAEMLARGRSDGAGAVLAAQAQHMRRRARDLGGEEGRELEREAARVEQAEHRARRARSRPARRAAGLDMNDQAMDAFGF